MKRLEAALLAGLILSLIFTIGFDFFGDCAAVRGQVLRLHILAASDSNADQQNKLAVRDALLLESQELFHTAGSVDQAMALAGQNLSRLQQKARQTLQSRGCYDRVTVELCDQGFSTRVYEKGTLPAGQYHSLKITIGEGRGKNWWCVMYPPLCIPTAAAPGEAEQQVTRLNDRPGYRMGFALVELWETAVQNLKKLP